jgi:hypothetical protein
MVGLKRSVVGGMAAALLCALAAGTAGASTSSNAKARTLIQRAIAATNKATSVSFSGLGTSSGKTVKINISAGPDAAYGTLSDGGATLTLRRVGTDIYTKSTESFLVSQGLSASEAKVEANKWFTIPSSDKTDYQNYDQYLTVSGILSGLVPTSTGDTISSAKRTSLGGQPVEAIIGKFNGQKGTVYVALHGTPYIVRVKQTTTASGSGTITLSKFNKPVHTTAPKGAVSI